MSKAKFTRMGHTALVVNDLKESLSFYKELLGCKGLWESDSDWAQLGLGPDDLSLVQKAPGKTLHPPHVGFRVETENDLQQMHKQLKDAGVEVEDICPHRDKSVSFYFKDPSGNILEALWYGPDAHGTD